MTAAKTITFMAFLTKEEQVDMARRLVALHPDALTHVVELVRASTMTEETEDGEFHFDLKTLPMATLLAIRAYLDRVAMPPPPPEGRILRKKKRATAPQNRTKRPRIHQCPHCDKAYTTTSILNDHVRLHTHERPYACAACGKTFSNSANLGRHMRSHTGQQPFACMFCGRPFSQSSNCKLHEKRCGGYTTPVKKRVQSLEFTVQD